MAKTYLFRIGSGQDRHDAGTEVSVEKLCEFVEARENVECYYRQRKPTFSLNGQCPTAFPGSKWVLVVVRIGSRLELCARFPRLGYYTLWNAHPELIHGQLA